MMHTNLLKTISQIYINYSVFMLLLFKKMVMVGYTRIHIYTWGTMYRYLFHKNKDKINMATTLLSTY